MLISISEEESTTPLTDPVLSPDTDRGESFMPLLRTYFYSLQSGVYVYVFRGLLRSVTITYTLEMITRFRHSRIIEARRTDATYLQYVLVKLLDR